ncbi:hypothetical protein KIPB_012531, partial [Kipferlia bialata]|eukprot:g12531.t1
MSEAPKTKNARSAIRKFYYRGVELK